MVLDEQEEMLHGEDEDLEDANRTRNPRPQCSKPCFNKVLLLAVGSLCIVAVGMAKVPHFQPLLTTALWDEMMYGSNSQLASYRRQVSGTSNNKGDLASWDTVMCHALQDNRKRFVQQMAELYPSTLHASCGGYNSPLEYSIHHSQEMVDVLLRAGAFVSDHIMVEAACDVQDSSQFVLMLLRGHGNANARYNGQSPMNCAAKKCHDKEVDALMRAGAYINTEDRQGFTPLLNALAGGCDSLADAFIQHGADINVQTQTGENALQIACNKCMANAADALLKKGIPVDHKDNQGFTALDSAVQHGCVPIASSLLKNPFTNVDEVDQFGQTALFIALQGSGSSPESQVTLVTMLLGKGADVNHQDQNGETPLMIAAGAAGAAPNGGELCQLLLQHGADVAKVDHAGNFALYYAASGGSAAAATSLLQGGSKSLINKPGAKGKTPLAIACWNTHPEVAGVLVRNGADPNIKDDYGQEPLSLATQFTMHLNPSATPIRTPQSVSTVDQWTARQWQLLGVLKVLVDAKVNLNMYDFQGYTPLLSLLRFQKNQWGVPAQASAFSQAAQANANFLLESGANPNMASKEGLITPLAFCAYNGYPSTARVLLGKGANRYAKNAWGKTPAQLCGGGAGQMEVAQLLR